MRGLIEAVRTLKEVPRVGWLQCGVPLSLCERVAEHSLEVAILSLTMSIQLRKSGEKINIEKVLAASLIHDLPEALIGDIPSSGLKAIGLKRKRRAELEALMKITANTPLKGLVEEIALAIEKGDIEARIVKASDLLSTIIQGLRFKEMGYKVERVIKGSIEELLKIMRREEKLRGICKDLLLNVGVKIR